MADTKARIAKLNDITDVTVSLTADDLRALLTRGGGAVAGCDYLCDCNHRYCTCNGSVSKIAMDNVSYPEFMRMREAQLEDLRRQLKELEADSRRK